MRDMQPARQDLHALAARVLKDATPDEAVLLGWSLVCGAAVANRTKAVSFQDGTLRVLVPDRGWKLQLEAFSATYLERLSRLTRVPVARILYEIGTPREVNA